MTATDSDARARNALMQYGIARASMMCVLAMVGTAPIIIATNAYALTSGYDLLTP